MRKERQARLMIDVIVLAVVTALWAAIEAFFLRRRMQRAMGRRMGDTELTSIRTWLQVLDAEKTMKPGSAIQPSGADPYESRIPAWAYRIGVVLLLLWFVLRVLERR
jgi:hypothetical protein